MKSTRMVLGLVTGSVLLLGASAGRFERERSSSTGAAFTPSATPRVVHVTGKDFSFDAPDVIPAGLTEFRFLNAGPSLHHMALLRLAGGKTIDDLRAALANPGPLPSWVSEVGGPNAAAPGTESNATLNLSPGDYAVICFVDLGGPPHFTQGMVKALRVVPTKARTTIRPKADLTATLYDYGFRLSAPLKAGMRTIRVTNAAKQHHEVQLVQLAPGASAADMLKWLGKMEGPPPGKPIGGVAGIKTGITESFTADFTPGKYALICFLPDATDGKPHFVHGMVREITVD